MVALPPMLQPRASSVALVRWEVDGTHCSFGQLLLLGRCAHLLQALGASVYNATPLDPAVLQVRKRCSRCTKQPLSLRAT